MKIHQYLILILTVALLTVAQQASAQMPPPPHVGHGGPPPHGGPGSPGGDPMRKDFYPPEMVMKHQNDISLSEEQRKFIIAQMQEAQKNFTEWQWSLESELDKMKKLLEGPKVDETQVLAQLDKVLVLEKQIKVQQLKLLVAVKNKLTPEQQKKLDEFKKQKRPEEKK